MAFTKPEVDDFKEFFDRDFPFGDTLDYVRDTDIERALDQVNDTSFNSALWPDQTSYSNAVLLLAAHYLVMNLRASSQGIAGQFSWLQTSKSAGSVSESFQIPDEIAKDPFLALLSKTTYGARYLMNMLPLIRGNVMHVGGATTP